MNQTPRSNRLHIAFFGQTNTGKSSLINALTNQDIALVSDIHGTTTDPVYKAMELLPLGPVTIIDTAGLNDVTELGHLRKKKTLAVLDATDIGVLVINPSDTDYTFEHSLIKTIRAKKIPLIGVLNKADINMLSENEKDKLSTKLDLSLLSVSAFTKEGVYELKEILGRLNPIEKDLFKIVGDLIEPGDLVVLVIPIDNGAPKGRLILPQQQVIRDILESDAIAVVCKEHELRETLEKLGAKPKMVITDSQAFQQVSKDTPEDILLTSFSILFARHKGDLAQLVKGAKAIRNLKDGDNILISEGCTHHRQSDDIGTVKIPKWLEGVTGKKLSFEYTSGTSFTEEAKKYALIIHCGACMLNKKSMEHRLDIVDKLDVPIVNYGVMIAYVYNILDRALDPFLEAKELWETNK